MPHDINRILGAVCARPWMIEPSKAVEIANALALRANNLPRSWSGEAAANVSGGSERSECEDGAVYVFNIQGTIMPRADMLAEMSGAVSMEKFTKAFEQAAADSTAKAIILNMDTPGGMVDLVPETAAMIYRSRREGRPIIAVANTMVASAGYYLAAAADEIVVTPSGSVGSIGVYTIHDDLRAALEMAGIERTVFFEGPRKAENHPWVELSDAAAAAIQESVKYSMDMFVSDVARFRGVSKTIVRADPEKSDEHFGGGRMYHAKEAVRLGMADSVGTLDETLRRVAKRRRSSTSTKRARLNLS